MAAAESESASGELVCEHPIQRRRAIRMLRVIIGALWVTYVSVSVSVSVSLPLCLCLCMSHFPAPIQAALARIRDGLDRDQVHPASPDGSADAANDATAVSGHSTSGAGALYAAELRFITRQLMEHSSWGAIFQLVGPARESDGDDKGTPTADMAVDSHRQQSNSAPTLFHHANFQILLQQVARDADRGRIFPPARCVFRAFELTPLDIVKVVIIGQVSAENSAIRSNFRLEQT